MTRARPWSALLALVAVLLLAGGLAACEATVTNGPMGDERLTIREPWRTAPTPRRSSTRSSSSTGPDGSRCEEEGTTCEGDACHLAPPGR